MFLYFTLFSITRGERVKTSSALSLPNHRQRLFGFIETHRQRLSPFVLSLSKYERTLRRLFKYLPGQ
ncbi:MAG: hypothetical protein LBD67_04650 [Candidatus Accumulibacter sp.]|nr:hypothetical protein [Accumulibacter sp.]